MTEDVPVREILKNRLKHGFSPPLPFFTCLLYQTRHGQQPVAEQVLRVLQFSARWDFFLLLLAFFFLLLFFAFLDMYFVRYILCMKCPFPVTPLPLPGERGCHFCLCLVF